MPRNMSFSRTVKQIRERTKTVTRRRGWKNLRPGEILNACVKCQGLKLGEKVDRMCQIRVVSVCREPLQAILHRGEAECRREGFRRWTPRMFVAFFIAQFGGDENQEVTRIEFRYLEEE